MRRKKHTTLGAALRRKWKTPRAAMQALGLPVSLLDHRRLAYDGALENRGTPAKIQLEEMLGEVLSGAELQRARDLLHGIDGIDPDDGSWDEEGENVEIEVEEAEDDEDVDEEELREQRRRAMAKVADFLSTKKGLDEI